MEFSSVELLRKSTFRYAFYNDISRPRFATELKNEQTWGFFSINASDFNKRIKLDQPSPEEKSFQRKLASLTKGRYKNYSLIVTPKWCKDQIVNHELSHFLYSYYKSYQNRARNIVFSFKHLEEIRAYIKSYNGYNDNELTEEIVSYLSGCQNINIPYRKINASKINQLKKLYKKYINRFFGKIDYEPLSKL
jgi:hypothetical protein